MSLSIPSRSAPCVRQPALLVAAWREEYLGDIHQRFGDTAPVLVVQGLQPAATCRPGLTGGRGGVSRSTQSLQERRGGSLILVGAHGDRIGLRIGYAPAEERSGGRLQRLDSLGVVHQHSSAAALLRRR